MVLFFSEEYLKSQIRFNPSVVPIMRENLTLAEQKMNSQIQDVFSLTKTSQNLSNEDLMKQLTYTHRYIPVTTVIEDGLIIKTTPNLIFVFIGIMPGNSTSIVDPFIYQLDTRDEKTGEIIAWVDVSNIENIANLSGVGAISRVNPVIYNVGSTETNATRHLNFISRFIEIVIRK